MFENNIDLELDDEIFDIPFEIEEKQPLVGIKRAREELTRIKPVKKACTASPARVVARKFPGPAGLLPDRLDSSTEIEEEDACEKHEDAPVYTQASLQLFEEATWHEATEHFSRLSSKYNIAWIKSRAKMGKLLKQKAPFLAAIVENIECLNTASSCVNVLLKDKTGEIHGTVVYDLFKEHAASLSVGSVMVLRQTGVLTGVINSYLTITANNLVRIYCKKGPDVRTVVLQDLTPETLAREIEDVQRKHVSVTQAESDFEQILSELGSTSDVFGSPCTSGSTASTSLNRSTVVGGKENKPKFNFKRCTSRISEEKGAKSGGTQKSEVKVSVLNENRMDESAIVENLFQDLDTDLLFDEF